MFSSERVRPEDRPYGPGNPDYEYDGREDAVPEVRFSHLRAYGRSSLHGWHARFARETDATYAQERGTAVHAIIFGTRQVCGYPGSQRRGKDFEAFCAEHPDHEILTMAEYEKARRMADAVRSCKLAEPFLRGIHEQTLRFQWMGLQCRATPDVRGEDYLTELKTSNSSEPSRFTWQALRMHYHAQMRMQQIAAEHKLGREVCYIVCVESTEPHPVTVFRMDDKALQIGERTLMMWAERLKNCEQSNMFPPYAQDIVPLIIPEDVDIEYGETDE